MNVFRRLRGCDRVGVAGAVIGLASLAMPWLTLKPTRLSSGTGLGLVDSVWWGGAGLLAGLWLLCLYLALQSGGRPKSILLGVVANLCLAVTVFLSGQAARALLDGQPPFTRVSVGAGVWVALIGAYIAIFAARQRLADSRQWQAVVSWSGLVLVLVVIAVGQLDSLSVLQEFHAEKARFGRELLQHIRLFAGSVAIAVLLAVPLGVWATRSQRAEKPIFAVANITQTVPSLALFGLLIAPLSALSFAVPALREAGVRGIGPAPAVIALVLYAVLPILANTRAGLRSVDRAVINAGRGMGMSRSQVFTRVEMPLASPLVLEGVRTASVQAVGNVTIAALIGAGGLGAFVFDGLGQGTADLILIGVIPIVGLALVVDVLMRGLVRAATPRGLAV